MTIIEQRISTFGWVLPPTLQPPAGVVLPFRTVKVLGRRVLVSGHSAVNPDGTPAGPFGKLGRELTIEQGYRSAQLTALAVLGNLRRAIGDLDRVASWGRVFGMVNSAPGFHRQPEVINGFSDLLIDLFGPEVGSHTRSAVGMAELPWDIPVEVECELELID